MQVVALFPVLHHGYHSYCRLQYK